MDYIVKKSNTGYQSLPIDAILMLTKRMVFLKGPITTESVSQCIKQLLYLEAEDDHSPVKLVLNTQGGSVSAGLVLYRQLQAMSKTLPIDIVGEEMCLSMGAILLAGGKPGHRFLLRGSKCMIHEPLVSADSGGISGSATSIQQAAETILKTKDMLCELLAADTGHTVEEIKKSTSFDNFMSDEEALEFGLIDGIVDRL